MLLGDGEGPWLDNGTMLSFGGRKIVEGDTDWLLLIDEYAAVVVRLPDVPLCGTPIGSVEDPFILMILTLLEAIAEWLVGSAEGCKFSTLI